MFLTGMANIRDVIPFPRTPGNAEFYIATMRPGSDEDDVNRVRRRGTSLHR